MTLIQAVWLDDGFDVYADTLVSGDARKHSSLFTKLLVLPVRYRTKNDEQVYSFELGMAVSGGVVVCTAIYGLLSSLLQDLRTRETHRPPLFDEIVSLAQNVAAAVFDDSAPNLQKASCFGFMLLGIDQVTGQPRWTTIATKLNNGRYEVELGVLPKIYNGITPDIYNGIPVCIGSAADAFIEYLRENKLHDARPSTTFHRFVKSGKRDDIGGGIAYMRVDESGVRLIPVLMHIKEGVYRPEVSGLDARALERTGKYYTLGRVRQILVGDRAQDHTPEFIPSSDDDAPWLTAHLPPARKNRDT